MKLLKKETPETEKTLTIKGAVFYDLDLRAKTGYTLSNATTSENIFVCGAITVSSLMQMRDHLEKNPKKDKKKIQELRKAIFLCQQVTQEMGHELLQNHVQEDYDKQNKIFSDMEISKIKIVK